MKQRHYRTLPFRSRSFDFTQRYGHQRVWDDRVLIQFPISGKSNLYPSLVAIHDEQFVIDRELGSQNGM